MTDVHYVLTVHHRSDDWIDRQTAAFRTHMPAETQLVAGVPPSRVELAEASFDRVVPTLGVISGNLGLVARSVLAEAADEDVIVFADADAFPIRSLEPHLQAWLDRAPLAAVRRDEMGDCQPHPTFAVTTAGFWRRVNGNWAGGHPWTNTLTGEAQTTVGGNLMRALELRGHTWEPILRTASVGDHPIWFGIYGDCVYHHGVHGCETRRARPDLDAATSSTRRYRLFSRLPGEQGKRLAARHASRMRKKRLAEEDEASRRLMAELERGRITWPTPSAPAIPRTVRESP